MQEIIQQLDENKLDEMSQQGTRKSTTTLQSEDTSSDFSDSDHFLTKGAFLLTPTNDLQMEKVGTICEKMNYKGPFSLTKTATGILFKFAELDDYQVTYKKGFHKVTGYRFYKKVPIPCRPRRSFSVLVFEVPEEIPEDDIKHSLYKFQSILEVARTPNPNAPPAPQSASTGASSSRMVEKSNSFSTSDAAATGMSFSATSPVVRITLANVDEYHSLLRDGLDFYGATFFPTEPAIPLNILRDAGKKTYNKQLLELAASSGLRIGDLLPTFESGSKIPTPATTSKRN